MYLLTYIAISQAREQDWLAKVRRRLTTAATPSSTSTSTANGFLQLNDAETKEFIGDEMASLL